MGCSGSTGALPEGTKSKTARPQSMKQNSQSKAIQKPVRRGSTEEDMAAFQDELIRKERERERLLNELMTAEKKDLQSKALPLIERRLSCENLLEDTERGFIDGLTASSKHNTNRGSLYGTSEHNAAIKLQKQLHRKQVKLLAEAEEKWMVC